MKNWKQMIFGLVLLSGLLLSGGPVLAVAAPVMTVATGVTSDRTASWSWTGSAGAVGYRYSLDNTTDWVPTTDTSFTPPAPLSQGSHILYVQESDGSGGWSDSGNGTLYCLETDADGTMLLADAADLTAFSDYVNATAGNGMVNARLTADIVLNNTAGNQWKPIGKDINFRYRGIFDGQGHTISGLYMSTGNWFAGLFGMSTGTIKNLTIRDSTISGGNEVGAIVGMANSGSQIINCHNAATVSGTTYVGGITGSFLGTLQNCSNTGAVIGVNGSIGGLVGFQQGTITNCFNSGAVRSTAENWDVNAQVGGISGYFFAGTTTNCYNSGPVSAEGDGFMCKVGAICGDRISYTPPPISNCYYRTGSAAKGIGSNSTDVQSETAGKVPEAFTSGEVAYRLQSGQAEQIWGQSLTGSPDPQPVLTAQSSKKVVRVQFDYPDPSPDLVTYHNPGDNQAIPQNTSDAITLAGQAFTASNYTVESSDVTFVVTSRTNFSGLSVTPYNGTFDGKDHPLVTITGQPAEAVVSYSLTGQAGTYTTTPPQINTVGGQDVYVKISDYYHFDYVSDKLTATVSPSSLADLSPIEISYPYNRGTSADTIPVTMRLPGNRGASTYSLGNISGDVGMIDGIPMIGADGILHYGVKSGAIGDTATIPVLVSSQNYTQITVVVKITLTDKPVLTIAGITVDNKLYDGSPVQPIGSLIITDAGGEAVDPGPLTTRYRSTDGGDYDSSTAPREAGAYQLVLAVAADHPDYRGSSEPLNFTISRRPITIRALDQTIMVGAERPADAIENPGLAAGETISGLNFSCAYSKNDAVRGVAGTYPINVAGGTISGGNDNYMINYVSGLLTVNPASGGGVSVTPPIPGVVITPHPLRFDPQGQLTVVVSGTPMGAVTYFSLDGATYTTTPPTITAAGNYPLFVKISAPGYADYLTQTTVTVEKADPPPVAAINLPYQPQTDGQPAVTELAGLLPADRGVTVYALASIDDPYGLLSGQPTIEESGRLVYRLAPRPATRDTAGADETTASQAGRSATVQVRVTMDNYADTTIPVIIREESLPEISYRTHIQNQGWESSPKMAGQVSGSTGQSLRLEAIQIETEAGADLGIRYKTHVQNIGWQDYVADGQIAGTYGQSLRLEAIVMELTGAAAADYDLYYQVHAQNIGWMDWAKNGESAGTAGFGYRLEALRVVLVAKGSPAPGTTGQAFIEAN